MLFLDGAPPPADSLQSDLHTCAHRKEKKGESLKFHLSYAGLHIQERM